MPRDVRESRPFTLKHFEEWAKRLRFDNGESFRLEPFQRAFVRDLFSRRPRFQVLWLVLPEGNGKTTLLAALGVYALTFSEEPVIPIAASSRDQIRIMYRQMKGFVRRSGLTRKDRDGFWLECFDGYRQIHRRGPGKDKRGDIYGTIEIHAADSDTADGVIPFPFAFLDELHRHKSLDLHRTWGGKLNKRGAQLVVISTAGKPGGDFELTRDSIRRDAETRENGGPFGRYVKGRLVMHEWALRDPDLASDLKAVAKANPLKAVDESYLAEKRADPVMTDAHWLRFTCNIAAETDAEPFINADDWKRLAVDDFHIPDGAAICIGADGSRSWDTTVVAWATALDDWVDVDCRVFTVRTDAPGHVHHKGGKIDFGDVEETVFGLFDRFHPLEVAYDPRYLENSMEMVAGRLPSSSVIPIEPWTKQARDSYQALFELVVERRLRHSGDPIVTAQLANCTVERDDRNQEIRRLQKIDPQKPIDVVPAIALAVWRARLAEESVYQSRDMVLI